MFYKYLYARCTFHQQNINKVFLSHLISLNSNELAKMSFPIFSLILLLMSNWMKKELQEKKMKMGKKEKV